METRPSSTEVLMLFAFGLGIVIGAIVATGLGMHRVAVLAAEDPAFTCELTTH